MNTKTSRLAARAIPVAVGLALSLQVPVSALAATDPADACELNKAKAAGKYSQCLTGVDAKAIKGATSADTEKLTKCSDKIGGSFSKAETKAEGVCPSSNDTASIQGILDDCLGSVVTSLGGIPGPGGDQAKCQAGKVKEAGKYAGCKFKALAAAVKDGVSPDFTKCDEKLGTKWTKLEEGLCSTTADQAAVKAAVDACYAVVAGNLHPTIEYSQDFELLNQMSATALSDDGWLFFVNGFSPDGMTYYYGYGGTGAPNGLGKTSDVASGQGGVDQGAQQFVVYSDYSNGNHGDMTHIRIETNVYHERTFVAGDVGRTITFKTQAKRGNINDPSGNATAVAFIKTLDPMNSYATTNFITQDTTALPTTWTEFSLSIDVTAGLVGQIFQFGFANTCADYSPSGNFYDNILVSSVPTP